MYTLTTFSSPDYSGALLHADDAAGQAEAALRGEDREAGEQRAERDPGGAQEGQVSVDMIIK
jgi:hypothetical protein